MKRKIVFDMAYAILEKEGIVLQDVVRRYARGETINGDVVSAYGGDIFLRNLPIAHTIRASASGGFELFTPGSNYTRKVVTRSEAPIITRTQELEFFAILDDEILENYAPLGYVPASEVTLAIGCLGKSRESLAIYTILHCTAKELCELNGDGVFYDTNFNRLTPAMIKGNKKYDVIRLEWATRSI